MDIEQAKKLAGGVLSAVGVTFSQQNYDDYKQDLLLLIFKEYEKDNEVSLINNPMLFKLLKWRLLDMLRKENRYLKNVEATEEMPAVTYSSWNQVELECVFSDYLKCLSEQDVIYRLLHMYLSNPRLSTERIL